MADLNRPNLFGELKRFARTSGAVGGIAARVAGQKVFGFKGDQASHAEDLKAILGGLKEANLDQEAHAWLAQELAKPASIDELVEAAESPELAAQIYTAARIAINPDTAPEKDFLAGLAGSLGLDAELVANIDAAASAAKI